MNSNQTRETVHGITTITCTDCGWKVSGVGNAPDRQAHAHSTTHPAPAPKPRNPNNWME